MPNEIYHRSNWGNANAEGFGDVYYDAAATNKLYNHSDYYENSDGTDKILRDLSNKASIVLTPTAYSDGSLNTVIPPYGFGPELVTNGNFDTDLNGWQITNSDATHTVTHTSDGARFQSDTTTPIMFFETIDIILQGGRKYSLTVEIVNRNSGELKIQGNNINLFYTDNGVFTDVIEPTGDGRITFYRNTSNVDITIKTVSVKEIQEADFDFSRGSSATRVNEKGLIESIASGLPRIDYTSGFGSLLLEPQRTNLIPYSEDFSQWILGSNSTLTYVSDVVAPDGSLGVYRLTNPASGATYIQSPSFSISNPLTISLYVKSTGSGNDDFNLYTGASNISDLKTATSEWQRFDYTADGSSMYIINSGDTYESDIYIWGSQAEAGSYATSYIPTSGSTVTRSADVANNSGNADLFNDSEGVLYAEISALANDGTFRQLTISDSSTSDRVSIDFTSTDNQIRSFSSSGGSTAANMTGTVTDSKQFNKVAVKYKLNDYALYVNGEQVATDTSAAAPVGLQQLAFDNGGGSNDFYGKIKELAVFKEALTDAELENLTSWVSFTEMATDLEYTLE